MSTGVGNYQDVWNRAHKNVEKTKPEDQLRALSDSPAPPPESRKAVDQKAALPEIGATKIKHHKVKPAQSSVGELEQYKGQETVVSFVIEGVGSVTVPAVAVEESQTVLCVVFNTLKPGSFFVPNVGSTLQMYVSGAPHKVYYPGALVTIEALGITVMTFIKVPEDQL